MVFAVKSFLFFSASGYFFWSNKETSSQIDWLKREKNFKETSRCICFHTRLHPSQSMIRNNSRNPFLSALYRVDLTPSLPQIN